MQWVGRFKLTHYPTVHLLDGDHGCGQRSGVTERWTDYRIYLNDLLPQYAELGRALEEAGIPVTNLFGTTSMPPPHPPDFFLLSYGPECELERLRELLRLALDMGCEAIDYTSEWASRRKIYLGSYGYEHTFTRVAGAEAMTLLDAASDLAAFIQACHQLPIHRE